MFFSKFDKLLVVFLFFVVGLIFVVSALDSVDLSKPYHFLQQISKSSTDLTSIDSDNDGIIDLANNANKIKCPDGNYKDLNECEDVFTNNASFPNCSPGQALVMTISGWGCKDESLLGLTRLKTTDITLTNAKSYQWTYGCSNAWTCWVNPTSELNITSIVNSNLSNLFDSNYETYVDINDNFSLNVTINDEFITKPITFSIRVGYQDKLGTTAGIGDSKFYCYGTTKDCAGSYYAYRNPTYKLSASYSTNNSTYNSLDSQSYPADTLKNNPSNGYCRLIPQEGMQIEGSFVGKYLAINSTSTSDFTYGHLTQNVCHVYGNTGAQPPPSKTRIYEIELYVKE